MSLEWKKEFWAFGEPEIIKTSGTIFVHIERCTNND
jgi:hypothetical protein